MTKPITPIFRCEITTADAFSALTALEWTADHVWLSATKCCNRATLRGVPGKRMDVIVDRRIRFGTIDPRDVIVAEVVEKSGRFDGGVRPRLALSVVQGRDNRRNPPPPGRLAIVMVDDRADVQIDASGEGWSAGGWAVSLPRLRSGLNDYNAARIVMWHWRRYFGFLPEAEVVALADSWAAEVATPPTLAEANRLASRALYRLARSLGWRKLTMRERAKLGLHDSGQWVPENVYAAAHQARADERDRLGVSDATRVAAAGHPSATAEYWDGDDV